jgi:hypothetical protein
MALYQGHIFIPRRLRSEDLAQLNDYQSQIDAYKGNYDTYKQQVEDYNKAIEDWNAGPRTSPFEGVEPTAPDQPGFTQDDIDAFQGEALGRATQRQSQLQTAVNVAQNPEAYGFGGFGFREGGMVPAYPSYGGGGNSGGIMSVLQPFGDYLNEQIDVQRVDPFLETVSNAAYQEFGIKPDQGGGFFSGGFYKGGGGLPNPDQGFDFSNPFPNMPQPIYERPEPNIPEGLFGGGPLPVPDGRPQDDPAFGFGGFPTPQKPGFNDPLTPGGPTVGLGNDGFGSVTQGPLDFYGGFPTPQKPGFNDPLTPGGPTVGMGYDGEFAGPPMQLPYDPTPMNPLIYNSLAAAGGLPDFAGSAQSYFNPGDGGQSAYGPMTLSPDRLVQMAQGRLAQRDVKPPEVQAYLNHIVQTGGNPTMMAPPPQSNSLALGSPSLMSASPGGLQLARTNFG